MLVLGVFQPPPGDWLSSDAPLIDSLAFYPISFSPRLLIGSLPTAQGSTHLRFSLVVGTFPRGTVLPFSPTFANGANPGQNRPNWPGSGAPLGLLWHRLIRLSRAWRGGSGLLQSPTTVMR